VGERSEVGEADGKGWRELEWACLGLAETLTDFEGTWPYLHEVGQAVQKEGEGADADDVDVVDEKSGV
jgi:hypothetical protein